MAVFQLDSEKGRSVIKAILDDICSEAQFAIQSTSGESVYVAKNVPEINTAIEMAAESVCFHKIDDDKVSNEKKFAHVCFWLLKLSPITLIPGRVSGVKGLFRRQPKVDSETLNYAINAEVAYQLFLTLYCTHRFDSPQEAALKISSILDNKYSKEVVKSLRFHNYSSRAMAMFLETLMMEQLG